MSQQLKDCDRGAARGSLEACERRRRDAIREWAEVNYVPSDGNWSKDAVDTAPRSGDPHQARGEASCSAMRSNVAALRDRDEPDRSRKAARGLDLIGWHRRKAGTIEHAHDVLMNELAGWRLPSQKFGANAAWLRLNVLLYNLLSAFKRVGLPEEMHDARPERLRFLVLDAVGKVVRHARETVLRFADRVARAFADAPRTAFSLLRPVLAGE